MSTRVFDIEGMHCAGCVAGLEKSLKAAAGVADVAVSLNPQRARVSIESDGPNDNEIIQLIQDKGYQGSVHEDGFAQRIEQERRQWQRARHGLSATWKTTLIGLIVSIPFLVQMASMPFMDSMLLHGWFEWLLATPVQFYVGARFYQSTWSGIRSRQVNMDTLVVLGTTTAYVYSLAVLVGVMPGHALYFEGSTLVITLVMLGKWLEEKARLSTTAAVRELIRLRPEQALLISPAGEKLIPIDELMVGDRVRVLGGQTFPADGEVVAGNSQVDTSMLTGESIPVNVVPGDTIAGGTRNGNGVLEMAITAVGDNTVLAGIVSLVESAQSGKAEIQRLVDRISAVFVPGVIIVSLITLGAWLFLSGSVDTAISAAVSVIIIACPCALGLATPTALVTGMGLAARNGILIRDIGMIEAAGELNTIAFDKTGTLTEGTPTVTRFEAFDPFQADRVLQLASAVQSGSDHPYAKAFVDYAATSGLPPLVPDSVNVAPGAGLGGSVDGVSLVIGNRGFITANKIALLHDARAVEEEPGVTLSYVAIDGKHAGIVGFRDDLRAESGQAIAALKQLDLEPVMLSGDRQSVATAIATQCGVNLAIGELSPEEKCQWITERQEKGKAVAMVGDGINDAPALATATVGIAMGSGTDIARQSAGVVLMQARLDRVVDALRIMEATRKKLTQNLFWAFIYNILAIPAAAMGWLTPAVAGAAMALSSVSVVGNSLLLRRWKSGSQ